MPIPGFERATRDVERASEAPWSELAPIALASLVFGMVSVPLVQALREWDEVAPRPAAGIYAVVALTTCAGLFLTLRWLRVARDGFAPTLHAEESPEPPALRAELVPGSPAPVGAELPVARIIRAGLATLLGLWTLITTGGLVIFTLI